jgi:ParE-like toxin of type II bacterial toxin-antitoxin system
MPYRINEEPGFQREVNKLVKKQAKWKKSVPEAIKAVLASPETGDAKLGNLRGLLTLSFERSPELRVLYEFIPCCVLPELCEEPLEGCQGIIHFMYVRSRANSDDLYSAKRTFWKSKLLNPDGRHPETKNTQDTEPTQP